MQILIVDNDKITLSALQNILAGEGHEVVTAVDVPQALSILRQGQCRVVICNWDLPGIDGIELCLAIRSMDMPEYVYVILVTGHSLPEERAQGLARGADDLISKPFDPFELTARLQTADRFLSLETRDAAIFAMACLAESRDPETGAHLERIRSYSRILAQYLSDVDKFHQEIDAEFIRLIYLVSPLHDIGKIGVPDFVLLKPGRLSDREFDIMKTHTVIGAHTLGDALRQFPGEKFLQMGHDIAACHHERFDGTGYPQRIGGQSIPLCARIVALADVYDALRSKRVYKEALDHEIAWAMIVEEAGAHFDPDIVDAFVHCEKQFVSIQARFAAAQALAA